jgi:hypothetical protein
MVKGGHPLFEHLPQRERRDPLRQQREVRGYAG